MASEKKMFQMYVVYIPFGEVFVEQRDGNWNTPYLFNAKELDEETGLYYYGARYLDPTAAQWLSVDPLFEKYAGMSPYNYCAGNPVKLVDLDGRENILFIDLYNPQNIPAFYNSIAHEKDELINIYCHADKTTFYLLDKYQMSPIDLMLLVENRSEVRKTNISEKKSSIFVFHSCESGDGMGSSVQQLSDMYKDDIFVGPNGKVLWKSDWDMDKNVKTLSFESADKAENIQVTESVEKTNDGREGVWNVYKGGCIIGVIPGNVILTKEVINEVVRHYEENSN